MDILPLELRKLGLSEKEVKVYLAGLELGPNSVQNIAKKAGLVRPTTYVIIESLKRKNLFTETREGKRRYFVAKSPDSILSMLRVQKRELEEKEREFIRIIAALETRYALKDKGGLVMYRGKEGFRTIQEMFSLTDSREILVLCSRYSPLEQKTRLLLYSHIKKRVGNIHVKEIYPSRAKEIVMDSKLPYVQNRFASLPNKSPEGTLILCEKAIFLPYHKEEGYLLEHHLMVEIFRALFLALWEQ